MSSHFSANQYESAFASQRLQNYQVSVKHKEHPSLRKGATKIIVNDRGHLNQDINRSTLSPWGSFVGTWQMERKPIQLKTRTKLTAHLYGSSVLQAGSKSSSRAGSAKSFIRESEAPTTQSPQPQALHSPKDDSRPNTADSTSSWVIIENPPSIASNVEAVDSRPPSQPKSNSRVSMQPSPLAEGSRAQSAVLASRSPAPAGVRQSPSVRSPSVMSAGDDVSLPPTRSNTAVSPQQTNSRPHSRMGGSSHVQAQSDTGSRSVSQMASQNLQTFEDVVAS